MHELCRGVWGYAPPENFQIWRLRNAISALVMEYVSEKSTSNKCEKAGVFSAYNIVADFPAMKMANNCKSLQSK